MGAPWLWKYRFNQSQINHSVDVLGRRCYAHGSAWWAPNYLSFHHETLYSARGDDILQKEENRWGWKEISKVFYGFFWMKKQPEPKFNLCRNVTWLLFAGISWDHCQMVCSEPIKNDQIKLCQMNSLSFCPFCDWPSPLWALGFSFLQISAGLRHM